MKPTEVNRFIGEDLIDKLKVDLNGSQFRIFRERDLHCCCYFHLRHYLNKDEDWRILNEPYLRGLNRKGRGAQPDIILFYQDKPTILIELKFRRRLSGMKQKDENILSDAVEDNKWVKKAYFIEAIIDPKSKTGAKNVPYRTKHLTLKVNEKRLDKFKEEFEKLRKPRPNK